MKKIISILFLSLLLVGCSVDDVENPSFSLESVAVESVVLPASFRFGETYPVRVSYNKPSTCHQFSTFYFESDENQRTVVVINSVLESDDCTELANETVTAVFNFAVSSRETYVFRFWQGQDENGNDTYHIVEVPVTN